MRHPNEASASAPTTISDGQDRGRAPTTYYAAGPEVGQAPITVSVPTQRMGVQEEVVFNQQQPINKHLIIIHMYIEHQRAIVPQL